jgi:hypothetical protein
MDEITREVDVTQLRWPASGHLSAMEGDSLNRGFEDLSGITWADTRAVMELEDSLLDRLVADPKAFDAYLDEDTELYEDICMTLQGLDPGTASAVFALNASGCLTFSSCSG